MALLPQSISSAPSATRNIQQNALVIGTPRRAILGDYAGNIYVQPREGLSIDRLTQGLFYARLPTGYTAQGTSTSGDVVIVRSGANMAFTPEYDLPVIVRPVPNGSGEWEIIGIDVRTLQIELNRNPAQYFNQKAVISDVWLRNIWDGREYPLRSASAYTQTTFTYNYKFVAYDGTIRNAKVDSATPTDYSADYPSDPLKETYALSYIDLTDGTTDYVVLPEQTTDAAGVTDANVQSLVDLLPHQLCEPNAVIRLDGAKGQIDTLDFKTDLRQFRDSPKPDGFPMALDRNYIIPAPYQVVVSGQVSIADGNQLIIEDDAQLVILPDDTVNNSKIVTTDYTLKTTDAWVRVDATGSAITITLPDASTYTSGRYDIQRINNSGSLVTIDAGSATINGSSTQTLSSQYDNITLRTDGSNWFVM